MGCIPFTIYSDVVQNLSQRFIPTQCRPIVYRSPGSPAGITDCTAIHQNHAETDFSANLSADTETRTEILSTSSWLCICIHRCGWKRTSSGHVRIAFSAVLEFWLSLIYSVIFLLLTLPYIKRLERCTST